MDKWVTAQDQRHGHRQWRVAGTAVVLYSSELSGLFCCIVLAAAAFCRLVIGMAISQLYTAQRVIIAAYVYLLLLRNFHNDLALFLALAGMRIRPTPRI
jgi:hypothetical protein